MVSYIEQIKAINSPIKNNVPPIRAEQRNIFLNEYVLIVFMVHKI